MTALDETAAAYLKAVSLDHVTRVEAAALVEIARLQKQLDDARAELDNMMGSNRQLGATVAVLASQAENWHADREEQRERADGFAGLCAEKDARIEELEAEVADLKREPGWLTGTASARADQ